MKAASKKFLVYYNEDKGLIGMRQHLFDWEEGDTITTDGVQVVVFGIFRGTTKNLNLVDDMFKVLRRFQPRQKTVRVLDEGYEHSETGDAFADSMNDLIHSHLEKVNVAKKVWKDFDAQLDFVDSVFAKMED